VSGTIARIAVRDHGPGVPAAVQRRIFRPFDRGDRDETSPIRGLGLGLALSRGLARDLGGELTLEDATGGGARFVLSLPTR
jgi:signal transduction histidine kinase